MISTSSDSETFSLTTSLLKVPLCPDHLRYEDLGEADNARGRVVRVFFWLMRWWR